MYIKKRFPKDGERFFTLPLFNIILIIQTFNDFLITG